MTAPSPKSRRVLVDTSAYYALADRKDSLHRTAVTIATRLAEERARLFTTNFILAETHALLLHRLGRALAAQILADLRRSSVTIVRPTARDEERAWAIIERFDDKDFSFTDAASFIVMERLRMDAAFAFDRDFARYGLMLVQ